MTDQHFKVIVSADGKQLRGEFQTLNTTVGTTNRALNTTSKQASLASLSLRNAAETAGQTEQQFAKIAALGGGLFGGVIAAQKALDFKDTVADIQDVNTRLRLLSGSTGEYTQNLEWTIATAARQSNTLKTMGDSYANLLPLQKANLLTQTETRDILTGLNDAAAALGASNQQLETSMYGLAQALANPMLQAEEMRQVMDPLPGLLQEMDRAAGLPAGGFRALVNEGEVTSEFFKTTLIQALRAYEGTAEQLSDNVNAKARQMQLQWELTAMAYEKPVSALAGGTYDAGIGTLQLLTENSAIVEAALVLLAARGSVALGALAAAKVNAARASRALKIEDARTAQQAHALAVAELNAAEATLARTSAQARASLVSVAAADKLKAAQQAVATAQKNVSVTSQRAAQSAHLLTTRTRALHAASSLLGGPLGALTLAGAAVAYFASKARSSAPDVDGLRDKIDQLLGNDGAIEKRALLKQIDEMDVGIKNLKNRIKGLSSLAPRMKTKGVRDQIAQLKRDLIELEAKAEKARAVVGDRVGATPDKTTPQNSDASDLFEKTQSQLARQIALYGDVAQSVRLRYELEQGSLKTLSDEHRAVIDGQISDLQRLEGATDNARRQEQRQREMAQLEFDLLSEEERIKASYQRRTSWILANTEQGSAKQQQLRAKAHRAYLNDLKAFHQTEKEADKRQNDQLVQNARNTAMQRQQALQGSLDATAQIFGNISTILMEGNRKQFEQGKKFAQAQAAVSGALAFVKALEAGPILGPILAGTIAALTTFQIAKIEQQQYQPAGAAHGGLSYAPDEQTLVVQKGERIISGAQNQDLTQYLRDQRTYNNQSPMVFNLYSNSLDPAAAAQIFYANRGTIGSMMNRERRRAG